MYTINGVALDDQRFGWIFRRGSQPFITLSTSVTEVPVVGKRGLTQFPTGVTAGLWSCVVNTPSAHRETLNALFTQPTLELASVAAPSRVAAVQFMASEVDTIYNADRSVDMRYTLAMLDAAWRDKAQDTSAAVALAASVNVTGLLPGGSAPVQDAIVRVKGAATGLQVTDQASGSWFTYAGSIPAGSYLRFEASTGRAFVTSTNTWSGGTEVSGAVDFGGRNGLFELTPIGTLAAPQTRSAALTVTTATRDASAAIEVRTRRSYID